MLPCRNSQDNGLTTEAYHFFFSECKWVDKEVRQVYDENGEYVVESYSVQ